MLILPNLFHDWKDNQSRQTMSEIRIMKKKIFTEKESKNREGISNYIQYDFVGMPKHASVMLVDI